jgi:hypothetical protein
MKTAAAAAAALCQVLGCAFERWCCISLLVSVLTVEAAAAAALVAAAAVGSLCQIGTIGSNCQVLRHLIVVLSLS